MTSKNPLWPKLHLYAQKISEQAGSDVTIKLIEVPFLRIESLVAKGELDGDFGREEESYASSKDSIVRVEEKIADLEFVLVSYSNGYQNGRQARNSRVAAQIGSHTHVRICKEWAMNCTYTNQSANRMEMLRTNRVDSILVALMEALEIAKTETKREVYLSDSLHKAPLYIFMAKKHEGLAHRLAKAIRKVKSDGTFSRIFGQEP
ncbi:MAG TPA: transporter substrate-binding domain-containing protein [Oligoflexus sp.]|uniref:substrate-binding periplasmic protein n=1 Tax=Oligoflexus sp. TaxID=1971216 RepID=UPI002D57B105|nr:transporter substrate-binding domain-containing protein [Oligoflexus sp.]HYX38960.1 transporter substrate-binding domain-containing protein [Oligoflexus sp.]